MVEAGGVRLKTLVMAASGTFGYGTEVPLCDRAALGGMVSKGIFLKPRPGTPPMPFSPCNAICPGPPSNSW